MTEHYVLHEIKNLTDRFGLTDGLPKGVKPRYNISPSQLASVIIHSEGKTELRMMSWGLVPQGAKDTNAVFRYKTFNTKSEKAFSTPGREVAVRHQRCIIPANGFYLWWKHPGGKDVYYFNSSDQSLMGLAGFYSTWTDPNGQDQQTYTMLTIEANKTIPLPFDRMPVILHADDETKWLDSDIQDFSSLVNIMRPYEGTPLLYHQVSNDISSAKIDTPRLVESIEK